ncbi:MAG: hypothetical protein RH917_08765 [Lacipirellulaceae bacterium]
MKHASATPLYTFDPGPIGSSFDGYWQSAEFPLDEPLSTVRFEVTDGKLLNLLPDVGQRWRLGMRVFNHDLSQNYSAQKKITFFDKEGSILLTEIDLSSTVHTQSGGASLWWPNPLLGVAAIEVNYDPGVPEVGADAAVYLFFNQRLISGTLQVVAVPEPSCSLFALGLLWLGCGARRRSPHEK